jgi:hypothetical protein
MVSRSRQSSKNWMISRQGSQRNMLREDSVFDISFEQLGQRGFMTAREIQWLKYFAGGNVPTHDAKNANRASAPGNDS